MSHNIQKHDSCVTLEKTWHRKERIVDEITYENSGLNWTVLKEPIRHLNREKTVADNFVLWCPEKNVDISVCQNSYGYIQNSQLFEVISNSLAGINFTIVAALSIGNLAQVALTVSLDDHQDYLSNGEQFKNFVTIANSFDRSTKLEAFDTSIKSICQNTLQWSRRDKGILNIALRHSKNMSLRIPGMEDQIEKLFEKRIEFYQTYERLASKPLTLEQAEKILIGFEVRDELTTRAKNKVASIHHLFQNGLGNKGQTVGDLLGGVTEYYTTKASGDMAKNYASSEFGGGRDRKLAFWEAITDERLDQLAARGEKLLLQPA